MLCHLCCCHGIRQPPRKPCHPCWWPSDILEALSHREPASRGRYGGRVASDDGMTTDCLGFHHVLMRLFGGIDTCAFGNYPDSNVNGAYMGYTWGRQDPGGRHVGPMNLAISVRHYLHNLVQDCKISSVLGMEILQSCSKTLIYNF